MNFRILPAILLAALLPLPLAAHIHVAPETAARGATLDLALVVGHGCKGAATTALRVALPAGLKDVTVAPKEGWQVSTAPGEVTWQGGPLPDHDKTSFTLRATIADDAPDALAIPVIQSCGTLSNRWIDTAAGADSPAPVLQITPAK